MADTASRPLRSNRGFRLLFVGQTTSEAGSAITRVVLPILVFQLTGSALQTAALVAVEVLPYLVFGLPAGAVADRVNRRVLMVGGDLVNAALLASIPLAAAFGVLTVAQVYVVALLSATAFVWSDAADVGALPFIVGRDHVVEANSALWSARTLVTVIVPSVAAALAAAIGAATVVGLDAISYLVSALAVARIRVAFGVTAADTAGRPLLRLARDVAEGLRFVRRHALIGPLTVMGFGNSFTGGAVLGLLVVYGVRQLGIDADDGRLGLLFSAGAAGGLLAAVLLPRLVRAAGAVRVSLWGLGANVVFLVGVALSGELAWSLALLVGWQGTYSLVINNGIALRQLVTPDRLQSRVNASARMVAWGGQPLGAVTGGLLAQATSVRTALLIVALGVGSSAALGWASPLRGIEQADLDASRARAEAG